MGPPDEPVTPLAGSWPTFYIKRDKDGNFLDPDGQKMHLPITHPNHIDFEKELTIVQRTLKRLTSHQEQIAVYYGTGVPTKQWTPVIDRLIDTYDVTPTYAVRILAIVQAAINDTMVIVWDLKYRWDVARPDQYDQKMKTLLCTPRFPTYPSGHATMSGCSQVVLSYFFPREAPKLKKIADDDAVGRLYAGVHFPSDNDKGLRLGKYIGSVIVNHLKRQRSLYSVDHPFRNFKDGDIFPDNYQQFIPYDFPEACRSLVIDKKRAVQTKTRDYNASCLKDVLSRYRMNHDKVPLLLQNNDGEYFHVTGAIGEDDCFQTFFFSVETVDQDRACATLSLLCPNVDFDVACGANSSSLCNIDKLYRTKYCIEVDLDCFCTIQYLHP
ncbi:phosphatase PAP2 family protein [Salibacterium salarium]|uniref:Phosphatase PAP2 family protein n=1 Tax=Salibacterium salarium TaxID=284579 RepID=A0A3R9QJ74_9BACI|nr:CotY/CotZ family spore coat protein [Salibacterium salarium]RSL31910.1 phosphatase PAP2 family protein [Salibacterium salarium]